MPGPTFCELTARFSWAKSDCGSTVPRKMDLYWFIPAFANSNVGSESGTTDEEGTGEETYQLQISRNRPFKLTECMPILLKIVNKCFANSNSVPAMIIRQGRRHAKVPGGQRRAYYPRSAIHSKLDLYCRCKRVK